MPTGAGPPGDAELRGSFLPATLGNDASGTSLLERSIGRHRLGHAEYVERTWDWSAGHRPRPGWPHWPQQQNGPDPGRQLVSERMTQSFDAIIVGAGFAGMAMLHRLRSMGLSARVIERADGVGGTWYWNRYPGARCDVESMEYSYQFDDDLQQEWEWTERYAAQPEILRYANHVADRFDLRRDITFETSVSSAAFDEVANRWTITTDRSEHLDATFFILAVGCLSSTNMPTFEGAESFEGATYHTGQWPHEGVDFSGLRVGVIGTGSSAIQSIPIIAEEAEHLTVFQRTANYAVPAHNGPLDPAFVAEIKADYADFRARNSLQNGAFGANTDRNEAPAHSVSEAERNAAFERRWQEGGFGFLRAFGDLALDPESNVFAADFVRRKIAEIVHDPATAALLSPQQTIGCKRLCVDTGYFETYNRSNVELVDVSQAPIEQLTPSGLTTGGREFELDAIVFATGFDAMTGSIMRIDIRGRNGLSIAEAWEAGPTTYLGLGVVGFPNMFTISGPGSPSVLTNMIVSIEQHVAWIGDCIDSLRTNGHATIEATDDAASQWVDHVNAVAEQTLFTTCNSWYLGANIPGKKRVFMPLIGYPPYVETCERVAANGYEGFALDGAPIQRVASPATTFIR